MSAIDPATLIARLETSTDPAELAAAAAELDALFAAHADRLKALCRRLTRGDEQQAAEISQEAMTVAYGKLSTFRSDGDFGSWLNGIARNLAMRASAKKRDLLVTDGVIEARDAATGVLTSMGRAEREAIMRRAAAVLDPEEQQAIHLRYVEGLSQDEITEALNLDAHTGARGLLQRCRRKLGRALRAELEALGHSSSFIRP